MTKNKTDNNTSTVTLILRLLTVIAWVGWGLFSMWQFVSGDYVEPDWLTASAASMIASYMVHNFED